MSTEFTASLKFQILIQILNKLQTAGFKHPITCFLFVIFVPEISALICYFLPVICDLSLRCLLLKRLLQNDSLIPAGAGRNDRRLDA